MTEQEMLQLHQAGVSASEIAKQAGLKYHAVWRALKRQGAKFRPQGKKFSPETLEAIRLYESGIPAKDVCEQTGVQRTTLYHALRVKGKQKHRPIIVKRFTEQEKADIVAAYQEGESAYSIGQRYGREAGSITGLLKRAGAYIPNRRGAKPRRLLDDEERQRITAMYQQGLSATEIGESVGRHRMVVQRELERLGAWEVEDPACAIWESPVIQLWCCGFGTEAIASQLGIKSNTAGYILRKHGLSPGRPNYSHNERFWFDWTPISAYWLGFLLADGCVIDRGSSHALQLILQERDHQHMATFLSDYEAGNPIRKTSKVKDGKRYGLVSTKITLTETETDQLAQHGLVPRKTYDLDLSCLTRLPLHLIRDALRGYIDGDGGIYIPKRGQKKGQRSGMMVSVAVNGHSVGYITSYSDREIGVPCSIIQLKQSKDLWNCSWSGTKAALAAQHFYQDVERSIERKQCKAIQIIDAWREAKKAGPHVMRGPDSVVID